MEDLFPLLPSVPPSLNFAPCVVPTRVGQLPGFQINGRQASLTVLQQGAHVIECSLPGTAQILYLSPKSRFEPGEPIRGGVPLVFPWFGQKRGQPSAVTHGFARTMEWALVDAGVDRDGAAYARFLSKDNPHTRSHWPFPYSLELELHAREGLQLELTVRNPGSHSFSCEMAFHTYLAVSDLLKVRVHGLENISFLDNDEGLRRKPATGQPITFDGVSIDRVYTSAPSTCWIDDLNWNRRLTIQQGGTNTTVVWNPGSDSNEAYPDLSCDSWKHFLCIESACAKEDAFRLHPGQSHVLQAVITANPLDSA